VGVWADCHGLPAKFFGYGSACWCPKRNEFLALAPRAACDACEVPPERIDDTCRKEYDPQDYFYYDVPFGYFLGLYFATAVFADVGRCFF
jgi:hypothetical protein